ncbi:MAG: 1-deoxy-D-xylulose-5-phosphate reductoisomerase [Actinomycetaceae bacterium]|nr:1-deoxy-D-xylulose-5-phosphate reductoisomerase [Actinomycetaceae bacterium]
MIELSLLGSTGSIGTQAIQVIDANPGQFRVCALASGGANIDLLVQQALALKVPFVAVADESKTDELAAALPGVTIGGGRAAVVEAAQRASSGTVLNGINGAIGLEATLAALQSGATLALANKESLVVGGALVKKAMVRPGQIVPVDSEHSAIAQCLAAGKHHKGLTAAVVDGTSDVSQLVLTASGGPFRGKKRAELHAVTAAQALQHPTWAMGPVVTINSSTLVNKGLELIEAHLLFDIDPEKIVPVIHPQSVVHSMVTWKDGSTIAQASPPSMLIPIALGLNWQKRYENVAPPCNWDVAATWNFEPVDHQTFPALQLARTAVAASPTHPAVYNAANEAMVDAFLKEKVGYLQIVDTVGEVLAAHDGVADPSLADIHEVEAWAKSLARQIAGIR